MYRVYYITGSALPLISLWTLPFGSYSSRAEVDGVCVVSVWKRDFHVLSINMGLGV